MKNVVSKQEDTGQMVGHLTVNLVFNDGKTVPFFQEKPNVITDAAKGRLLATIYDSSKTVLPDPIQTFRVGDGGTLDGTVGLGGIPGVNARPLSGAETSLFNLLSTALYSHTALSHNLQNATTATAGTWASATGYNAGDTVAASSSAFSIFVFEAQNTGTSGGSEPAWPNTLGSTVVDNDITWVVRPRSLAFKSVTYSFSISSSQLNGYNISEVGLFRESGGMFNIKTFPSIPKSSAFSIQFLWTIKYV